MKQTGLGLMILFMLLIIPSVTACSCFRGTSLGSIKSADIAFVGLVDSSSFGLSTHTYTFTTSSIYKGDLPSTIEIKTATDSAACGTSFEEGKYYLVFAEKSEDGSYSTGLCSGNMNLDSEEFRIFSQTYYDYSADSNFQGIYKKCNKKDTNEEVFMVAKGGIDTTESRLYDSSGNMIDSSYEGMTPVQRPLQTKLDNCKEITRAEFEKEVFKKGDKIGTIDGQPIPRAEPIPQNKGFWARVKGWFANIFN